MVFTYDGAPGATPVDTIRFLTGDTDESEYFLEDAEINWLYQEWIAKGTPYYVAAMACDAISAKLAREVTINSDGQTLSLDQLQEKYSRLSQQLREQHEDALVGGSSLYAGGMEADKRLYPDVAPLAFGTRMHDNPEAGRQDYGDTSDLLDSWQSGQWGEAVP